LIGALLGVLTVLNIGTSEASETSKV
jgi:hypothetical protein